MKDVHEKACSGVTCEARSVTKASETVVAVEVMGHALNKEALKQFNSPKACTPAIALCQEPSE